MAVVGPNGAGKTTLLRVDLRAHRRRAPGALTFEGAALAGRPAYEIVAHGIAHVPEGRRLFPALTVAENLKMGAFLPAARAHYRESLERVYAPVPGAGRAPGPARGQPLGRRAADAGHRPRAHVAAPS